MSGVDVLAVMKADALDACEIRRYSESAEADWKRSEEARAAVSELIDAARPLLMHSPFLDSRKENALRDALARVTGGSDGR